jgi:hypothetical protein
VGFHSFSEETMIMTLFTLRWSIFSLVGFALWGMTGCARWIDVPPSAPSLQETMTRSLPNNERVPLVMDSFTLVRNDAPQPLAPEMERRILNSVLETSLFSTVMPLGGAPDSLGEKIVAARVTVTEMIDPHSGLSALKGIVIGASMFLLSPFINLEYDYAAKVGLELERWDDHVKRYEARSSGTVRYKLFGATPVMIDELKGHVTEACLADLTRQLVRDTNLYMASSAPLPDRGIRMVTVKARKPASALSMVPVTTATAP